MVGLPIPSVRRAETGAATSAEPSGLTRPLRPCVFFPLIPPPREADPMFGRERAPLIRWDDRGNAEPAAHASQSSGMNTKGEE